MWHFLTDLDHRLLLVINHAYAPWLDAAMTFASDRRVWLPFYALLLGWLGWQFRRRVWLVVALLLAAVGLADRITSGLFKGWVQRPRPCHAPDLLARHALHLPDGCGGAYGFMSSHAANAVALAVFLWLALPTARHRGLKIGVALWAAVLCYSRVYLGAHYPSDVVAGALVGAALATAAAAALRRWSRARVAAGAGGAGAYGSASSNLS